MLSMRLKVSRPSSGKERVPRRPGRAIARGVAGEIDQRVFQEGRPVEGRPSYADHGAVKVPTGYALGGQPTGRGVDVFANSAALRVRGGYAATSEGMRRGLVVRSQGGGRAVVLFEGSSMSANPVWAGGVATSTTVPNDEKAATVLTSQQRNVLELTEDEVRQIALVSEEWARRHVGNALRGRVRWRRKPRLTGRLANRIMRER